MIFVNYWVVGGTACGFWGSLVIRKNDQKKMSPENPASYQNLANTNKTFARFFGLLEICDP